MASMAAARGLALFSGIDRPPATLESSQDCFACSRRWPKSSETGSSPKALFVGVHFESNDEGN
jgi:hypothetical protein